MYLCCSRCVHQQRISRTVCWAAFLSKHRFFLFTLWCCLFSRVFLFAVPCCRSSCSESKIDTVTLAAPFLRRKSKLFRLHPWPSCRRQRPSLTDLRNIAALEGSWVGRGLTQSKRRPACALLPLEKRRLCSMWACGCEVVHGNGVSCSILLFLRPATHSSSSTYSSCVQPCSACAPYVYA